MEDKSKEGIFQYLFLDLEIQMFFDYDINEWYLSIYDTVEKDQVLSQFLDTDDLKQAKTNALLYIKRECYKKVNFWKEKISEYERQLRKSKEYVERSGFKFDELELQLKMW